VKRALAVAAPVCLVVVLVASCNADDDGDASGKKSSEASAAASERSPDPSPLPDPATATPTEGPSQEVSPGTAWEELEADGDPDDVLEPADVKALPKDYFADPNFASYDYGDDEEYELALRRDVASYLLRLRHADRRTADALAPGLALIPTAWCSVVAPNWTWRQFRTNAVEAGASARLMADLLEVPIPTLLTTKQWRFMKVAARHAARQFCPDRDPSDIEAGADGDVDGAGNFPERDAYNLKDLAQDGYPIWQTVDGPSTVSEEEIALTLQMALVGGGGAVATLLECGDLRYLSRGLWGARQTAENILELHETRGERILDIEDHLRLTYEHAEQLRRCRGKEGFSKPDIGHSN
jgi:hypothetical protein